MQDIVPKKSIREITKPRAQSNEPSPVSHTGDIVPRKTSSEIHPPSQEYPHLYKRNKRKGGWRGLTLGLFVFALVAGGIFLHFQKSATVYITTEKNTFTVKATEIALPATDIVTLTVSTTTSIEIMMSTGTPLITKAKGKVTIFNANSTEQPLIATTRLQTPQGKIYRLDTNITVPKATTKDGKSVPGSVEVAVTADQTGESYNITQSDFSVPGLLGSPRYKNVYARTKNSILGGVSTTTRVVNEKDKTEKINTFVQNVRSQLKAELDAKKDPTFVSIDLENITSAFEKTSDTQGLVTVTGSVPVVDERKVATLIAKSQKPNETTIMQFMKESKLPDMKITSLDTKEIRVSVNGQASIESAIDTEALKILLSHKPFNQFRELVTQVTGVKEIRFTSKPFWISEFPAENKIFIEVQ